MTITGLRVQRERDLTLDDWMEITLNKPGDASTYALSLVQTDETGAQTDKPLAGCDPVYASASFSFKASCPTDADCAAPHVCPPQARTAPPIDYLAKDYASFRQLILDRLAQTLPDWTETHIPDIGVMLVDLLAYAGDQLSYYQDAVATEAYLGTARRRISVRRHARLVDYRMHEGCNARAWVVIAAEAAQCALDPTSIFFGTAYPGGPAPGILEPADFAKVPAGSMIVFEPLSADPSPTITLREAHNAIRFYTWGDCACCLPTGATSATLADYDEADEGGGNAPPVHGDNPGGGTAKTAAPAPLNRILNLSPGDILVFEEVLGPKTGAAPDADPTHRQAVRLTERDPRCRPALRRRAGRQAGAAHRLVRRGRAYLPALPLCHDARARLRLPRRDQRRPRQRHPRRPGPDPPAGKPGDGPHRDERRELRHRLRPGHGEPDPGPVPANSWARRRSPSPSPCRTASAPPPS